MKRRNLLYMAVFLGIVALTLFVSPVVYNLLVRPVESQNCMDTVGQFSNVNFGSPMFRPLGNGPAATVANTCSRYQTEGWLKFPGASGADLFISYVAAFVLVAAALVIVNLLVLTMKNWGAGLVRAQERRAALRKATRQQAAQRQPGSKVVVRTS